MNEHRKQAPGFCGCGDHHPHRATDTWCYVCDKPLLPVGMRPAVQRGGIVPTGTGWPDAEHSSDGGFRYPVNHGPDRPVTAAARDWDAEAAEREQYTGVMAADLADQQCMDRKAGQS